MKNILFLTLALLSLMSANSFGQDHSYHARHNMVLFGKPGGFYASHIVYKSPHNFQVILKINFDEATEAKIATEMTAYPKEQFIYLLDHMDISGIQKSPSISGQVFRRAEDGSKQVILNSIGLNPSEYSVVYFDELPLSLSPDSKVVSEQFFSNISPFQCAKDDERPGCCEATSSCRPSSNAGLILAFANLDSAKTQATQSDLNTQCEPFTITVAVSVSEYESSEREKEILNKKAVEMCYGRQFIIDNSSIRRNRYQIPNTGFDPKFAVRVTAKVACMNY